MMVDFPAKVGGCGNWKCNGLVEPIKGRKSPRERECIDFASLHDYENVPEVNGVCGIEAIIRNDFPMMKSSRIKPCVDDELIAEVRAN